MEQELCINYEIVEIDDNRIGLSPEGDDTVLYIYRDRLPFWRFQAKHVGAIKENKETNRVEIVADVVNEEPCLSWDDIIDAGRGLDHTPSEFAPGKERKSE